jgi:hypothetical protein
MSYTDIDRSIRLSVSPIKLNVGYESFNYASTSGALYVPANPADAGAESKPVSPGTRNTFEFTAGLDVKLDLMQWAYIKYQLDWDSTSERLEVDENKYNAEPVANQTPYAVGAGSTFAVANEGGPTRFDPSLMHRISVGFYPIIVQEAGDGGYREQSVALELGVATKNYTVTTGWVRDGVAEIDQNKDYNLFGFTWGIYYQDLFGKGKENSYFGGISFGLKGTHFVGNTQIFTVEMSVPFGLGWQS